MSKSTVVDQPGHPVSAMCVLTHCQHMDKEVLTPADLIALRDDMRKVARQFDNDGLQDERLLDGSVVSHSAARVLESYADQLDTLITRLGGTK